MSEIPPTCGQGAGAPVERTRTPPLSDEAERILQRRGRVFEGNIARFIRRLNLSAEHDAVRQENELILDALRSRVAERYGPSIADRSVRILRPPPTGHFARIDRSAVAAGWQHARSSSEEIRGRPEVKTYLKGGDAFRALSRRFNPPGEAAVRQYERNLIDSLATRTTAATAHQVAAFAEWAALDCLQTTVRRADRVDIDYRQLAVELEGDPESRKRFGCFSASGMTSLTSFASFAKTDQDGGLLTRSTQVPVVWQQDKVHLSVNEQDVPKAWEALRALLLSEDNPFLRWKMTILANEERALSIRLKCCELLERAGEAGLDTEEKRRSAINLSRRLCEGGQFTLYPYAHAGDLTYGTYGTKFRHFLELLDRELAGHGVRRGKSLGSDVLIEGLAFATYRNAKIGTRGADVGESPMTDAMIEALKTTPFYQAISR